MDPCSTDGDSAYIDALARGGVRVHHRRCTSEQMLGRADGAREGHLVVHRGIDEQPRHLRVVFEHDGELGERMMRGTHSDVRTLARSIAGSQDLIPIWDPSWIHGSASRPPADRYERRRP
ncbi:MAG: hypothetical protein M5U19_17105 [Microthrixaceae bacterium]|nr:hypothetical protein [Microthrixaceae bacterium]